MVSMNFLRSYTNEKERNTARILFKLILLSIAALLIISGSGIHYGNKLFIVITLIGSILQIIPLLFLFKGILSASILCMVFSALGVVTFIASIGQGIHDQAIITYPIIILFAGWALRGYYFQICIGLTLAALAWLVFGEANGLIVPRPYQTPNWIDFVVLAIVLMVGVFAVRLLATDMWDNLDKAQKEIAQRKVSEEKLRATIEEKETLLREVHHRVKNNLQVIIALIKMRSNSNIDIETKHFLEDLEGQARTMSLVYEQLYQAESLSRVNMEIYLRHLTSNLIRTFHCNSNIQMNLNAPLQLDVAHAMPCGLIVNELITNILKHAFPPGKIEKPMIAVSMWQIEKTCHLMISDNGLGLPVGFDLHHGKSMGLRLVELWAKHQLGGTLDVTTEKGTTFKIVFNIKG
jgi:two-component sensor histidine kinase